MVPAEAKPRLTWPLPEQVGRWGQRSDFERQRIESGQWVFWEDWRLYLPVAVCADIPALTDGPFRAPVTSTPCCHRNHARDRRERNGQKLIIARLDSTPNRADDQR